MAVEPTRSRGGGRLAAAAAVAAVVIVLAVILGSVVFARGELARAARAAAEDHARINAERIGRQLERAVATARALARAFEAIRDAAGVSRGEGSRPDDREVYNALMRRPLETNDFLLSVWALFEPDALDGEDARYRGSPGSDATGRFVSVFSRAHGTIRLDPVYGYEDAGSAELYYYAPLRSGLEMVTDPYMYSYSNDPLDPSYMTTVSVPVFPGHADGKDQAIGVAGVDLGTDFLRKLISEDLRYNGETAAIASGSGTWIIHPDPALNGSPIAGIDHEILARIKAGESWEGTALSPVDGQLAALSLEPIRLGQAGGSWTFISSVPVASVEAELARMAWIAAVAGLAAAAAAGLVLSRLFRAEKLFRESEAVRQANAHLAATNASLEETLAALRDTQRRLVEAERQSLLGRISAATAHELNTPLAALGTSAETLSGAVGNLLEELPPLARGLTQKDHDTLLRLFREAKELRVQPTGLPAMRARALLEEKLAGAGILHAAAIADDLLDAGLVDAGETELALLKGADGEKAAAVLATAAEIARAAALVGEASDRTARYVRNLQALSRRVDAASMTLADLAATIETALSMREAFAPAAAIADRKLEPGLGILCRPEEIIRLWSILIKNAFQAAGPSGQVRVEAEREGAVARIRVIDNGPGVPEEIRARLFEPLVTTRPLGEGVGLGLSEARRIALTHDGAIEFAGEVGRTCFTVTLPLALEDRETP